MTVIEEVQAEMQRAVAKFPTWPTDPLHAVGVLNEEVGELNRAVLQAVYEPEPDSLRAVREEAIQSAAMALRFLESLFNDQYSFMAGQQHKQANTQGSRRA